MDVTMLPIPLYDCQFNSTELHALYVIKYFSFPVSLHKITMNLEEVYSHTKIIDISCIHILVVFYANFKNLAFFIDFIYGIQYVIHCFYPSTSHPLQKMDACQGLKEYEYRDEKNGVLFC